ncbi:Alkanal monooxygenase alpha chain [Klebsiella aerogenes]|nr:Alkanal monooxygenase alpha chain [Klebsiella aerogenes]
MAGVILVFNHRMASPTLTWRGAILRCCWTCCAAKGFAKPNPQPMFPNPPGLLRLEPYSAGLRERIWWGAGSNATAMWAAKLGMNLQSSTLKDDETGEPFHIQQAKQIRAYRQAWTEAGHTRMPRVSVSRSIFALMNDRDRMYFGSSRDNSDSIGFLG